MAVQRWTAKMLDNLASSTIELRNSITEFHQEMVKTRDSTDELRITSQALLQVAAQSQRDMEAMKERQAKLEKRQAETENGYPAKF